MRGPAGTQAVVNHTPTVEAAGKLIAIPMSDQYPKPPIAMMIPTMVLTNQERISIVAKAVNRIWRWRSAKCWTPAALKRKPAANVTVTQNSCGSW